MKIGIAQIASVFLDKKATTAKVVDWIGQASAAGCELVAFGEALIPAYPIWLCRTDAARFDAPDQKELHALYVQESVLLPDGDLNDICQAARDAGTAVIVGIAERAAERGGHTLYCSRVIIDHDGEVLSVHRKLMPTYEERLAWGTGDGSGLVTHRIGEFTVGALNCWENWMPLARAALYAAGENLHVMLWPGCVRLTEDITRFVARESRSYVVSASGLIRAQDLPADVPQRDRICSGEDVMYDGGSCIATPEGEWLIEPRPNEETLLTAELDVQHVFAARQNFDPAGHYARPDVLNLTVDRRRHKAAQFLDDES